MDNHSTKPVENEAYAFPASFAQQRLWFLHRLEPNSPAYNVSIAFRLSGPLNVLALKRSFQEIVSRHETLRTTFALIDGEAAQIVAPAERVSLPVIDLRPLAQAKRDDEMRRVIEEESKRPFDLEKGPLLRLVLLRMADDEHALIIHMHHIISDGWSLPILFRELTKIYGACSEDIRPILPELPIQYADYAIWQRDCFAEGKLESQVTYWKKQLSDIPVLQLPTDRPRRDGRSERGARRTALLPAALSDQLRKLSRSEGATLFMTLVAAFQVFLHRYSGQQDIAVGTPIAGRTRPEIENLIGFFVNTLVIRTDFSNDPSFRQLLARVRSTALDAYDNQDLPFEKLVQEINPDRSLSHTPLFQVMFSLQTASDMAWCLPGVKVSRLDTSSESVKFDLSAFITEKENSLRVSFSYNADLFNDATIERWLCHLESLFEAIVEHPDRKLSELSCLREGEKHQLLVDWNQTETDFPKDHCIHELFEAQVERTPNAVALVSDGRQLTYKELNARANQLAHYLKDRGLERDGLVGVCFERSFEMIVALLGTLKAGGAYVPLDPTYPKERLGFMLEDTHAGTVLTDKDSLRSLPPTNAHVICLDRDWEDIANEPRVDPSRQNTADSLAYVIYTSGSTGVPKGVEVRHRGVVRLLFGVDYVQLDEAQTFLHLAPISFDAATFEVWGALLHGGKCVLFPGKVPGPRELGEVLKKQRVNTLWLTAALFNTVINEEPHALADVKQLLVGGEALSVPHVRKGLALLPNTEIVNGYGPTESTTFTCCYRIPRQLDDNLSSIPIGKPIGNTQVYVLDPHLNPVPIGVAGELYIGGDGLARGYLKRPELTLEKFIQNPFSKNPTARLYRTGDLARYLSDGNIEFVGRIDEQVKIRGFRIEPGEIETALAQHPSLREAVIVVREDDTGNKRLIAYIVADQPGCPNDHTLRSFLKQRLPEYMMPTHFVSLNNLPLTLSGKIDRKALPPPAQLSPQRQRVYVEPRSPTEEVLAAIWSEVLNTTRISVHDDFFELGGHSLLAIRLLAQLRDECQLELSVRQLFEAPTIAGLAAKIEITRQEEGAIARDKRRWSHLIEIQRGTFNEPVFIIPGGGGAEPDLLKHFRLARCMGKEFSFYGLVARGSDGISQPHASVEEMAADYLKEIRSLQPAGPYYLLGECIGGIVAYEVACQLRKQNQEVALLMMTDTFHPTRIKYLRYRYGQVIQPISTWWKRNYYAVVHNYYVRRITFHLGKLLRISWREKASYLINKANVGFAELPNIFPKASGTAENASAQISLYSRPAQERYLRTLRRHKPKPYNGKIVMVTNEKLYTRNPTAGWANLALGGIDVQKVSGVHDNYIHDHIKSTAKVFKACLVRARNGR